MNNNSLSPFSRNVVAIVVIALAIWGLWAFSHSHGKPPIDYDSRPALCSQMGCEP